MKISRVISEIAHDGRICMEPQAMAAFRKLIFSNMALGANLDDEEKKSAIEQRMIPRSEGQSTVYLFPSDDYSQQARREFYGSLAEDDEVVNVITIAGPMTRGGGACSYGSIEMRDLIMEAAKVPQVKTHILYTRTPGGMSSVVRDFRQATNYARAHGQKVYMYCDGDVFSAGTFTGAECDGIYAMNTNDQIGSLGMYSAFFTQKDGDKDFITQETYHEYYASRSSDKNLWWRAAAEGDMSLIAAEVDADLEQMLADAQANRPQILDEQLSGKTYRMGDVEGSLVDGFCSLTELAEMALAEWHERDGAALPAKEGATKPAPASDPAAAAIQSSKTTQTNNSNMKSYPNLGKAAGLDTAFEQQADGFVALTEEQADTLEANIESATQADEQNAQALADEQARTAELSEQNTVLTADNEALRQQLTDAQAHVADLESQLSAAQQANSEAQTQHESAMAHLQAQLDQANATVQSREATINDLNATIAELNAGAGERNLGGGAPQNNGTGVQAPKYDTASDYDPSLSLLENKKRKEEREAAQRNSILHK